MMCVSVMVAIWADVNLMMAGQALITLLVITTVIVVTTNTKKI